MGRGWLALILACLLLPATPAFAQGPGQPGAPGMPGMPGMPGIPQYAPGDPGIPVPPSPPGYPQEPSSNLPLPRFGDPPVMNAFDGAPCPAGDAGTGFFCNLGFIALTRAALSSDTYAVLDPGVNMPPFPPFFDHGDPPPAGSPPVASLSDLSGDFGFGFKGNIGFYGDGTLFEVAGFYIPSMRSESTTSNPARLDLPFANFPPPLGFEGNNGLWLQADQVKLSISNEIGNFEMNLHFASQSVFNFMLGFRYFDLNERFSIFTDDDGLTISPNDPTLQADYSVVSHSRIVGPHFGFQFHIPLDEPEVFLGAGARVVPGINFNELEVSLVRGDGFRGPAGSRSQALFSQLFEFNLMLEVALTERSWIRAGYQALLLLNVPVASDQINFDPQAVGSGSQNNGMILFHGPMVMLQY